MTDPNERASHDLDDQAVESGGVGLDGDAAGAAISADLTQDAGADAPGEGNDTETLADKAALVEADSILDPVTPESGGRPR